MPNHNRYDEGRYRNRDQEEYDRRRYEDERMNREPGFQNRQDYPRGQASYSQGGYQSDEFDRGGSQGYRGEYDRRPQDDYNRGAVQRDDWPQGGQRPDWRSGGQGQWDDWRASQYGQGDDGRQGGSEPRGQGRWGNYNQHEDSRARGGQQGRWGSPGQRDDWRSASQVQREQGRWGGYGQGDFNRSGYNQDQAGRVAQPGGYGRGMQMSSGMGGTYEGEFGPEPGSQQYGASDWGHSENWLVPGPMSGRGPEGYQRSDDRIKEDICERLTQHGQLDASKIRVDVTDCEVTLQGTVDSRGAKRMAEDAVESVQGVRDVHNQLRVQHSDNQSMGTMGGATGESLPKGQQSMSGDKTGGNKRPTGSASNENNGQTTMGSGTTQTQKSGTSQTGGVTGKSDTGGRTQQSGRGGSMKNDG